MGIFYYVSKLLGTHPLVALVSKWQASCVTRAISSSLLRNNCTVAELEDSTLLIPKPTSILGFVITNVIDVTNIKTSKIKWLL
jgi:hypothetical protein